MRVWRGFRVVGLLAAALVAGDCAIPPIAPGSPVSARSGPLAARPMLASYSQTAPLVPDPAGPDRGQPRDGGHAPGGARAADDQGRVAVASFHATTWSVVPWPLVTFSGIPEDPVPFDQPVLVTWAEGPAGTALASRTLITEEAPFVGGACAAFVRVSAMPAPVDHVAATGRLSAGRCYRYTVHMVLAESETHDQVSPPLWVAAPPEPFFRFDLYRDGVYSPQQTWTWCTAASVQMMANMVQGQQDASYAGQLAIIGFEHARDRFSSSIAGSDPQGMVAALSAFGAGSYRWSKNRSSDDALREAALAIRTLKRPAALFVNWGSHAWVMSGFTATVDPLVSDNWQLTGVYVEGPLYPRQVLKKGFYDPPPDQWYSIETMRKVMLPYWETIAPSTSIWQGAIVTTIPDAP